MGRLVPVCGFETLPGDTVQIRNNALIRVTPLVTPVMHPVQVRFHTYFVPNRILDPEDGSFSWEKFITGGEDGMYATPPPQATRDITEGTVADYLGITPGTGRVYNTFLMKAYAKIWQEYYRDQQLQSDITLDSYTGDVAPFLVNWGRDYFTKARPESQLGPEVTLPLGNQAPVIQDPGTDRIFIRTPTVDDLRPIAGGAGSEILTNAAATANENFMLGRSAADDTSNLVADLSSAGALNINDMRRAFAIQRYQEARNLYGARFVEYLRYLGIRSSDARLDRPEYIGGGKGMISFSEVLTTNELSSTIDPNATPVGTMRGHGISAVGTKTSRYFCEEHGHILTLMSVRPKNIYMQSQHKMFNRQVKEEYWQRELQQIGQQPIQNRELYADHSDPDGTFGWNDRYADYKHVPSMAVGEFRSILNSWHLGREFAGDPALNTSFVECRPTNRIYADTADDTDKLWCMVNNSVVVRSMLRKNPSSRIL